MGVGSESECVAEKEKRPLLTSREWAAIQIDKKIGWGEWQEMDRTNQRQRLEDIGCPRRRPARNSTEELEGSQEKQDIPNTMDVIPGCQDGEMGRDVHKLNRGKRPKLTTVAIARFHNCDRPLNDEERCEVSIERQGGH